PAGVDFSFFGAPKSTLYVCTNGMLSFSPNGLVGGSSYNNAPIGNAAVPNDFIAPLWDDYNLNISGTVHTQSIGAAQNRQFIIQWTNVALFTFNTAPNNTFQVVLHETSSTIEFRYAACDTIPPRSATIGVEDATGASGTSVADTDIGTGNTARQFTI